MTHVDILRWVLNAMELIACISGFYYYNKVKNTFWRFFPFYLGFIFLMELTAKFSVLILKSTSFNVALYTYFGIPIQFLFFFWIFYQYNKNTRIASWSIYAAVIFIISLIIDQTIMKNGKYWFFSISYTVGNILLLVLIIRFFVDLVLSENVLHFKKMQMFWVCLGLLIFYLGSLPFFGLNNTLRQNHPSLYSYYWYVQMGLNYCMYACFSISFIWSR